MESKKNSLFDMHDFLRSSSKLALFLATIPYKELGLIESLAHRRGISTEQMERLVSLCLLGRSVDLKRLNQLVEQETESLTSDVNKGVEAKDLYPIAFLKHLRDGAEPTSLEKYMLRKLIDENGMNPKTLNILLEDIFNQYQGKININKLEQTALQWIVNNIHTVEEARRLDPAPTGYRKRRVEVVPSYFYEQDQEQEKMTPEEIEELKIRLKNIGI